MDSKLPAIIDLNAVRATLTLFRGRTPRSTWAERMGSAARLGPYRDGILLVGKSQGIGHWETHPADELVHVLDGEAVLEMICDDGPPQSFALRADMLAVVPPDAWHRFRFTTGATVVSATLPGDHIDLDVDDPRTAARISPTGSKRPLIADLNTTLPALTMVHRTPQSTPEERKGSVTRLAPYRDGLLLAIKAAGTDHWEVHPDDELIHILDGTATLDIVCDDGPPRSFTLCAGTMAAIPGGAWHRFHSAEGATQIAVTPFPGKHIELDVDDPRTVGRHQR